MLSLNPFKNVIKFLQNTFAPKLNIEVGTALLAGGAISGVGSFLGGREQADAAAAAANASRFSPVGVSGPSGTVVFDPAVTGSAYQDLQRQLQSGEITQAEFNAATTGGFQAQLSPELQSVRDRLLGMGVTGLDQFQTFDPVEAGRLYEQQLTGIAAPQEQQQRLQLENRLFQQGLTGGTTGNQRTEALLNAQALAQGQRNLQGMQFGQQEQGRLFEQALGGLQGALTLDQQVSNQINQAISASGAQTTANANAAQFQFQAGQNQADAIAGFFGGIGQGFTNMAFQPQQSSVAPDYHYSSSYQDFL